MGGRLDSARRTFYRRMVARGGLPAGYALEDGVGLHYIGTELAGAVTVRPGARVAMLEAVFIGRQIDEWEGVPATGRDVRVPYAMAYEISGGFITALHAYFPMAAVRAQLTRAEVPSARRPQAEEQAEPSARRG